MGLVADKIGLTDPASELAASSVFTAFKCKLVLTVIPSSFDVSKTGSSVNVNASTVVPMTLIDVDTGNVIEGGSGRM